MLENKTRIDKRIEKELKAIKLRKEWSWSSCSDHVHLRNTGNTQNKFDWQWFYVFCKYRDHHIKNPRQRIFSLFWKRIPKSSATTSLVAARLDHRRSKADQQDFPRLLEHVLLNHERKQCDRTLPVFVTQLTFFLLANGSGFLQKAKDPRMPRRRITVNSKRVILKNLLEPCV